MNLKEINLGSDTAERDISEGLLNYFYQNDAYKSLLEGKKTITMGNRGAGKSAIFKYLAAQEKTKNNIVLELSPEEYSYEILQQSLTREGERNWGRVSAYSVGWQFLLYNLIFKEIVNKTTGLAKGARKNIYEYVRDNLKCRDINPIGMLISYLKRLENIKLEIAGHGAGAKVRKLQALYKLEEIDSLLPSLQEILQKTKVYVFVDELDKGWDNSEDAKYFVAGLFQAAQKMNLLSKNLKIFVSIRQEIFDNIPQLYDDAQKIREDIQQIRWSEEELLEFLSLRIKYSWKELGDLPPIETWNNVFSEVLEYRGTKSFNYLIDRTQLRPREFLQFCKACLEKVPEDKGLIDYQDITKAEVEYSEAKTRDLASEYRHQYPGLLNLFEAFRGQRYIFERDDLDFLLLEIVTGDINVGDATWVRNIEFSHLKKILWEIGFLKAYVVGGLKSGRKSGSAYLGFYELPHVLLENVSRFQVHPAFRVFLSLKEKK